ncbi:MAG TPA: hypothetical protein V6D08_12130 [Candidatus Obscuribacterales bacterium]
MRYLVGKKLQEADQCALAELQTAGIPAYKGTPSWDRARNKEVQTSVVGVLEFADGQLLVAERCMDYWSVRWLKEIPAARALKIEKLSGSHIFYVVNAFRVNYQEGLNMLKSVTSSVLETHHGNMVEPQDLVQAASLCFYGLSNLQRV